MFRVSRRPQLESERNSTSGESDLIELSLLKNGQTVDIDLENVEQLELVCLASNSWPQAKITWIHRRSNEPTLELTNAAIRGGPNEEAPRFNQVSFAKSLVRLASRDRNDTASKSSDGIHLEGGQFSSILLHNLTHRDHQNVITCQANSVATLNSDRSSSKAKISFISLNVIRSPLMSLQVENSLAPIMLLEQNLSLLCKVDFSNPSIESPITWLLNETLPIDGSQYFSIIRRERIHYLSPNSTSKIISDSLASDVSAYQTAERLTIQAKAMGLFEFHCGAKNKLNSGSSNRILLIVGMKPHCNHSIASLDAPNGRQIVKCPVISHDRSSARFHWSAPATSQVGGTISTLNDWIELWKLVDHQSLADVSNFTCFVSDKFGSNQESPCTVSFDTISTDFELDQGKLSLS